MTPETQAAAERVARFLDAWEDPDQGRGAISTLRTEGLRLTPLDLRLVLAALDPAEQPDHTEYGVQHPDGSITSFVDGRLARIVSHEPGNALMKRPVGAWAHDEPLQEHQ